MKIRSCFVSNSSSSSFIVALPKKPDNTEELFNMLFPGEDPNSFIGPYEEEDRKKLTLKDVSDIVYNDIINIFRSTTDPEEIKMELECDYFDSDETYTWDDNGNQIIIPPDKELSEAMKCLGPKPDHAKDPDAYYKWNNKEWDIRKTISYNRHKHILTDDSFVFCVEYKDRESAGAQMENCNVFRNVKHIRIVKH